MGAGNRPPATSASYVALPCLQMHTVDYSLEVPQSEVSTSGHIADTVALITHFRCAHKFAWFHACRTAFHVLPFILSTCRHSSQRPATAYIQATLFL